MEVSFNPPGFNRSRTVVGLFLAVLALVLIQKASELVRANDAADELQLRTVLGEYDPLLENPANEYSAEWQRTRSAPANYYLIQFDAPLNEIVRNEFEANGVTFLDYIPHYAYIVHVESGAIEWLQQSETPRWIGEHPAAMRVDAGLSNRYRNASERDAGELGEWLLDAFPTADLEELVGDLEAAGAEIVQSNPDADVPRLLIRAPLVQLPQIAAVAGVSWIEAMPVFELQNDVATEITGVAQAQSLGADSGYFGKDQIIAIADSGLDRGDISADMLHDDFEDGDGNARILAIIDRSGDGSQDVLGHGTHVAGIAVGNGSFSGSDSSTGQYSGSNAGVAPAASLVFQAISNDRGTMTGLPFVVGDLFEEARANVADGKTVHIHSNSWGASGSSGYYSGYSRDADKYMWDNPDLLVLFSAGNSGRISDGVAAPTTVIAPGTSKNALTVGATQKNLDRPDDVADYSGAGPTLDGRLKPDLVAPGMGIVSVASQARYDEDYVTYSGTSMSTPHVAGMAALVREYFGRNNYDMPSAALIKAMLINGANGNGHPTMHSGWGRADLSQTLNLDDAFDMLWWDTFADGDNASTPLSTGERISKTLSVNSSATPLQITLVWTDGAGSPAANGGLVNDLDLHLIAPDGSIYYPDNANNGGLPGDYDHVNNVLGIHLETPQVGDYQLWIAGFNVTLEEQSWALVTKGEFADEESEALFHLPIGEPGLFEFDSIGIKVEIASTNATGIAAQLHNYSPQELLHGTRMLANAWTITLSNNGREPFATGSVELTYDQAEYEASDADDELSLHILRLVDGKWEPIYPDNIDVVNNRLTLDGVSLIASSDWAIGFSDPTAVSTTGHNVTNQVSRPWILLMAFVLAAGSFVFLRYRFKQFDKSF